MPNYNFGPESQFLTKTSSFEIDSEAKIWEKRKMEKYFADLSLVFLIAKYLWRVFLES